MGSGRSAWDEMSELRRFSSRRDRLDHAFLNEKLKGARSYRRIAGYFRSSIFELVGEEIVEEVPDDVSRVGVGRQGHRE